MVTYPAVVLEGPSKLQLRELPLKGRLSKGEVLLEVMYAGVCGTDVAIARGDYPVPLPLVILKLLFL